MYDLFHIIYQKVLKDRVIYGKINVPNKNYSNYFCHLSVYFYLGKNACSVFIYFGDNENFCLATSELRFSAWLIWATHFCFCKEN